MFDYQEPHETDDDIYANDEEETVQDSWPSAMVEVMQAAARNGEKPLTANGINTKTAALLNTPPLNSTKLPKLLSALVADKQIEPFQEKKTTYYRLV